MIGDLIEWIFVVGIMYGVAGTLVLQGIIIIAYHLIEWRRRKKASDKMEEAIIKTMQRVVKEGIEEAKTDGKQREEH